MKRIFISSIIVIIAFFTITNVNVYAAGAGIVSTDKTVTSGQDGNVTVTISSNVALGSYEVQLTDTGGLTLISASGGEVSPNNTKVTSASSSGTTTLANFSFDVPSVNTQTKYVVKFSLTAMEGTDLTPYDDTTNSATITVNPAPEQEPDEEQPSGGENKIDDTKVPTETQKPTTPQVTKSSNNYLSGITIGTGTLSPEFYRETFEYIVEFDDTVNLYDLKEIEISATAEDNRATVEGAGTIQLNDGENNITLTVTAENGTARTYTIKVIKPMPVEQSALRLQTLVLNGINASGEYQTINLDFDPETFEYNLTVPNDITSISVNPTTENEDIIIETTGGESLNEGDNRIIIILTSPSDETIKTTYTINVERQAALVTEEQGLTKEQLGIMIIASVVGVILLIVIIVAIVKHVRKKKRFDYDDEDEDVEMPLINNEEGEDVGDYDDIEDPYPSKIVTSGEENKDEAVAQEQEEGNQEELKETNTLDSTEKSDDDNNKWFGKKDKDDELKFKTTYDEENTVSDDTNERKSKWDDFVDGYDDDDEAKAKKKKHGKRFL